MKNYESYSKNDLVMFSFTVFVQRCCQVRLPWDSCSLYFVFVFVLSLELF